MSSYCGSARSNYFNVKDEAAFLAAIENIGLGVYTGDVGSPTEGMLALHCMDADGGTWPLMYADEDDDEPIGVPALVAAHLADGQVCVLVEVGAEKMRYLGGVALAFDNTSRPTVQVDLSDIYRLAEEAFGVAVTDASY